MISVGEVEAEGQLGQGLLPAPTRPHIATTGSNRNNTPIGAAPPSLFSLCFFILLTLYSTWLVLSSVLLGLPLLPAIRRIVSLLPIPGKEAEARGDCDSAQPPTD